MNIGVYAAGAVLGLIASLIYKRLGERCGKGIHNFQAVYDEYDSNVQSTVKGSMTAHEALELFIRRKYVKHVCTRCGAEVLKG